MKKFFILLSVLLFGTGLSYWIQKDSGYILINYHHTSIETSLWAGILFLLLTYILLQFLVRIITRAVQIPSEISQWQHKRTNIKQHKKFNQAVMQLCACNLEQAYDLFTRVSTEQPSTKAHLGAALAAFRQGDVNKMNKHFSQAKTSTNDSFAILFCHAEALYQLQDHDAALIQLNAAQQAKPRQSQYYRLAISIQQAKKNGPALLELLPPAFKYSKLSDATVEAIEFEALQYTFTDPTAISTEASLNTIWKSCSRVNKRQPALLKLYYNCLQQFNQQKAAAEIEKLISKQGFTYLIDLYTAATNSNHTDLLAKVESWLEKYPQDVNLLTAASEYYQQEGMFKKAINSLKQANNLESSKELMIKIAEAYHKQGDNITSIKYYQASSDF